MTTNTGRTDPETESGGDEAPASNNDEVAQLPPLEPKLRALIYAQNNDVGNADRFFEAVHEKTSEHLKFVVQHNQWIYWDQNKWELDEGHAKSIRLFIGAIQELYDTVSGLDPRYFDPMDMKEAEKVRGGIKRGLHNSLNKGKILAALDIASKWTQFRISAVEFDADPFVAACKNGHIDINRQKRLNPDPGRLITKQFNAEFNLEAKCERWDEFIDEITCEDEELAEYLQKLAGYFLTGDTSEHIAINITGSGCNGKSVFTNALMNVWGDYAVKVPNDVITKQGRGGSGDESKASPQTAMLKGARLACTSELEEGMQIGESKFKDIVSSDLITARPLHKDPITWKPTHKLVFCGNYEPTIRGNDEGIWRRFKQIKFIANIAKPDLTLEDQFKGEEAKSYILHWALKGWEMGKEDRKWSGRIKEPKCIIEANNEYRSSEDILGQFLDDCCNLSIPNDEGGYEEYYASQRIIRLVYESFCNREGYRGLSAIGLNKALKQRGITERKTMGIRLRRGIEVKPEALLFLPQTILCRNHIVLEDRKLHGKLANTAFYWWLEYLRDVKGHFESWDEEGQKAVSNIGTNDHSEVIRYYKSDEFPRFGKEGR